MALGEADSMPSAVSSQQVTLPSIDAYSFGFSASLRGSLLGKRQVTTPVLRTKICSRRTMACSRRAHQAMA